MKLNLGVTVFVSVRTNEHNDAWLQKFNDAVDQIPEIVELYRMSGDIDYLMKIVVASIAHYDQVYKRLIKLVKLTDVSSSFAMEQMKYTTGAAGDGFLNTALLNRLPTLQRHGLARGMIRKNSLHAAKSVEVASACHAATSAATWAFFSAIFASYPCQRACAAAGCPHRPRRSCPWQT